jgi:hypothetical protein
VDWWVYLIAGIGVLALGVAAAFLARFLYVRQVRRSLVRLLGRREAVVAAAKGLERVLEHLMADEDDALATFAGDAGSDDRRALEDIASRMRITADDLHAMALPKRLWSVAEEMERADGRLPQALAAYNAGGDLARAWAARLGPQEPPELYIDVAEYAETRTYLKTVLGNIETYRRLYALP